MLKSAILVPGNGVYFTGYKKINGRIHPFRKNIYERINKQGYLCEFIGINELQTEVIQEYHSIFILNMEKLGNLQKRHLLDYVRKGGNLILTYKSVMADDVITRLPGRFYPQGIDLNGEKSGYRAFNIDRFIYKFNRKFLIIK